ncbi:MULTISPECIES: hypothetical protein [unclassified Dyella]|uniref:hypothetical protein n=1 Tax=unclassified Dyella TaxID=2634549 RepID=UPI003F93717A
MAAAKNGGYLWFVVPSHRSGLAFARHYGADWQRCSTAEWLVIQSFGVSLSP